jgi:hypothetical protein
MNCLDMPRVRKTFVLDERVMNALDSAAKKAGYKNANQFVEATLFNLLKLSGNLEADAEPLTEGRGGKREGAGKPKKATDEQSIDSPPETTAGKRSGSGRKKAVDEAIDGSD